MEHEPTWTCGAVRTKDVPTTDVLKMPVFQVAQGDVAVMPSRWSLQPHVVHTGTVWRRRGKNLCNLARCWSLLHGDVCCGCALNWRVPWLILHETLIGVLRLQRQYGWEWSWSFNVGSQETTEGLVTWYMYNIYQHIIYTYYLLYLPVCPMQCSYLSICEPARVNLLLWLLWGDHTSSLFLLEQTRPEIQLTVGMRGFLLTMSTRVTRLSLESLESLESLDCH